MRRQLILQYRSRLSGPLLDRIDLHIEVPAVPIRELARQSNTAEPSGAIRERVNAARLRQRERYADSPGVHCNAHLTSRDMRKFCKLTDAAQSTLENAMNMLGLSARAYDRIIKVGRTVADMAGQDAIDIDHVAEAIGHRSLDRQLWK